MTSTGIVLRISLVWVSAITVLILPFTTALSVSSGSGMGSTETLSSSLSLGGDSLRELVTDAARHHHNANTLDLNGIMWLEHINLIVKSKTMAEYFYIEFLGCTRDSGKSFHVNMGQQQFHLAESKGKDEPPQRIAGSIGLVVPSLQTLRHRIPDAIEKCRGTKFAVLSNLDDNDTDIISLTCPDGNLFHLYSLDTDIISPTKTTPRKMENLHAEGGGYGPQRMAVRQKAGIRYLEIVCPVGSSDRIAKFYEEMLECTVVKQQDPQKAVMISVGPGVDLVFVERGNIPQVEIDAMKGVHVCIYVNDFVNLYKKLSKHDLTWTNPRFVHLDTCDTLEEAIASRTLRFKDIIDLSEEETKLVELEHETRPLRHGQYLKVPNFEPK